MKVLIAYTVVSHGKRTSEFLERFRLTYDDFPAGYPADVVCVCNGGPASVEEAVWMRSEWKCLPRKNDPGWDLSGYQNVALTMDCDMLVCFGESVFFHRKDWLVPLVKAWESEGPGMYGIYASNLVYPHLNTTAFAIDPNLLKSLGVFKSRESRHWFEHGLKDGHNESRYPFWTVVKALGKPVRLVTFSGVYKPGEWRATRAGLWQTDQSDCLVHCIHTERYRLASEETKRRWEKNADGGLVRA